VTSSSSAAPTTPGANRSDSVARVAFVLVDGRFTDDLLAVLPEGAVDGLMHAGPKD